MELQENWIWGQTDRAGAVATGGSGVHTETSETKNGELYLNKSIIVFGLSEFLNGAKIHFYMYYVHDW